MESEARGIFQSDVIIRSAIMAAIRDLRLNPWLLDYVFASLLNDPLIRELIKSDFPEKEIEQARRWFLGNEIVVFMSHAIVEPKFPCVTISLVESSEQEATLADVHYVPKQDNDSKWPALTIQFTPVSYNALTGVVTIPDAIADSLVIAAGMMLVDSSGRAHEIIEMDSRTQFKIAPGTVANFTGAVLKGRRPAYITTFESVKMQETYSLGCHVQSEGVHLTYLHSVIVFCLLRYKETLLEGRGFERAKISSSDFMRNGAFEQENVFSRHIQVTGYVTQTWPKQTQPKITSTLVSPLVVSVNSSSGSALEPDPNSDESWLEQDSLTARLR
jgi:hypothetical protein